MTREEAIEYQKAIKAGLKETGKDHPYRDAMIPKMKESCEIAIKALEPKTDILDKRIKSELNRVKDEQEHCEDAISRQAVLDINESHHGQMPNHINHQIWQEVKDLPSVQPKAEQEPCEDCQYREWLKGEIKPKTDNLKTIDYAIDASNGDTDYFVGLRNGMRYVKSLIDGKEPQFESCAEQEPKTVQEKQADSEKYQKAFDDGYDNGYAQARFDYEQEPCDDCIRKQDEIRKAYDRGIKNGLIKGDASFRD